MRFAAAAMARPWICYAPSVRGVRNLLPVAQGTPLQGASERHLLSITRVSAGLAGYGLVWIDLLISHCMLISTGEDYGDHAVQSAAGIRHQDPSAWDSTGSRDVYDPLLNELPHNEA